MEARASRRGGRHAEAPRSSPPVGTARGPDAAHPYALHRLHRVDERQGRRVRRVLGGDRGVRLLLRGARALRLQLADQLGAREHVPHVRHAVHAVRAPTPTARTSTCASTSSIRKLLAARQGDLPTSSRRSSSSSSSARCSDRLRASRWTPSASASISFTEWGIQYWPVKLDDPDRRRAAAAAGHLQADQGHPDHLAAGEPEPWASRSASHGSPCCCSASLVPAADARPADGVLHRQPCHDLPVRVRQRRRS